MLELDKPKLPPTNDPKLPSYWCDEYRTKLPTWTIMGDVYAGDLNTIDEPERYLPRNSNEGKAYAGRLVRTVFENHTAPIIDSYAGTLGMVEYGTGEKLLKGLEQDVDLNSNSLEVFFDKADIMAMRDGLVYVLTDYYREDIAETREQELQIQARPFLRLVPANQIINWEKERGQITRCVIAEWYEVKSAYGSTKIPVFRKVNGAEWEVVQLVQKKDKPDEWIEVPVFDDDGQKLIGEYTDASGQPLKCCPITVYQITGSSSKPYFYNLAKLNIRLYQSQSDYWELLHKCNWPVPCFAIARGADITQDDGSISIGPNDALILGENGNAFYLQPSGDSAAASQESIMQIQNAINSYGLTNSLLQEKGKAKTATEIRMLFATVQKQIARFAAAKESAVSSILEIMAEYLGSTDLIEDVEVVADVSALLTDEKAIIGLYNAGLLSLEAAVARLSQLGYHPDTAAELVLLKAAEAEAQEAMANKLNTAEDYKLDATA